MRNWVKKLGQKNHKSFQQVRVESRKKLFSAEYKFTNHKFASLLDAQGKWE